MWLARWAALVDNPGAYMDPGPAARDFGEALLEKTACIYPASCR